MALKFTKNQTLILEILFYHPEQSYYLRELGRMLGKKPGVFQRDINNLVKAGVLENFYRANSRFFILNKKYPLYREIKNIFFKTVGVQNHLKKTLSKIKGVKQAFIYGSYAAEREGAASDIDLFVIGSINEDDLIDVILPLEKKFNREINYVLITEKEFQQKKSKNSFINNILRHKIIKLI